MKRFGFHGWPGAAVLVLAGTLALCARAESGDAAPDLVITSIVPTNANPDVPGSIDITVTILNQGDAEATLPFSVDLYYNMGSRPKTADSSDETEAATDPLAPDESTTVTFIGITNAVAESWGMYAWVDKAGATPEANPGKNNNISGPVVITWGGGATEPDLKITAITPFDPAPTPGTPISVFVTVMNAGNADANSFRLDLFTNPATEPDVGNEATDPAPLTGLSLAAGVEQMFEFTGVVSATAAVWQMYAIVDTLEAISELQENNNVYGPEPLVWGTAASLALDSPDGTEVWEVGTVHNITWTSIGDVGDYVMLEYSTDGGVSVWVEIIPSTLNDGQYEWTIPDDPSTDCVVKVSSTSTAYEDTSAAVFTIEAAAVARPDLKILAITPSDANPLVDELIDVSVTVLNQGNADAGFFTIDLFQDRGVPPVVGESEGLSKPVASLGAGLSTQVTFSGLTSSVATTWAMYAIADTGGFIDESNKDNNVGGPVLVGWGAITVTSPNGTEVLEAGDDHDITWSTEGLVPPFHIEYSTDGGTSWDVIIGLTFNVGSFTWTVPADASTNCRVLVSNFTGTVTDVSDEIFEIQTTAELVIMSVTPSDAHPIAGETISVTVIVENQGTADAGAFAVALFESAAASPAVGDSPDSSRAVASLAAGEWTAVTFEPVSSGVPGVWDTYVIVDNGTAVTEKDELNNISGPTPVVWHPQPWLGTGCAGTARESRQRGAAGSWALLLIVAALLLRQRVKAKLRDSHWPTKNTG
jgi:hypothetical protein